ncbi:MAG: hypothetical protein IJB29_02825 [Mailhella sp.]|nr:hypothetical protein [Mailhella sp.]
MISKAELAGGSMEILRAGNASDIEVTQGGSLTVNAYATHVTDNVRVSSGGIMHVKSGNASDITVAGNLANDGTSSYFEMDAVAKVEGLTLQGDGAIAKVAGSLTAAAVNGGSMTVSGASGASLQTIVSGGVEYVIDGASSTDTEVTLGRQVVSGADAVASGTILNEVEGHDVHSDPARNIQQVSDQGLAQNTVVNAGACLDVFDGGSALGAKVYDGGLLKVGASHTMSGGAATSAVLYEGAEEIISEYGKSYSTLVSGGVQTVLEDGDSYKAEASDGGQILVKGGAIHSAAVSDDASIHVSSGSAKTTTVESAGSVFVYEEGRTSSTTLHAGGSETVREGGKSVDAIVEGGSLVVGYGGSATGADVNSGSMHVHSGGLADTITVEAAGCLHMNSGARVSMSTTDTITNGIYYGEDASTSEFSILDNEARGVHAFADFNVVANTSAFDTFVMSGGRMNVDGNAVDTVISSYGKLILNQNGVLDTVTVFEGGSASLSGTAENLSLRGGLVSVLDNAVATSNPIHYGLLIVSAGGETA